MRHLPYKIAIVAALAISLFYLKGGMAQVEPVTAEQTKTLLAPPLAAALGEPQARVSVIEYMDYNCPYCRQLAPELVKLTQKRPNARIVYKEWPIFGSASLLAAQKALAANYQGKYLAAHDALISSPGHLTDGADIDARLRGAGIDLDRLAADFNAHEDDINTAIRRNADEAHALGFQGTPGIVIGKDAIPGVIDLTSLEQRVDKAAGDNQ